MPTDEGKCSRCGFKAPIICFLDAAQDSQMVQLFTQMPNELQKPFWRYLTLFRPASGCAMQQSKVERLTREFLSLVSRGYISEKGKVDRHCPPAIWAMGMERMQEQAATLALPMKNHNYLRAIVYQLADQADANRERGHHQAELNGSARAERLTERTLTGKDGTPVAIGDGLSQLERNYLKVHGHLPGHDDADAIKSPQDLAEWARKTFGTTRDEDSTAMEGDHAAKQS